MADASIIDIGGTQWNVKDKQARNDIETINQLLTVESLQSITITINNGYSASVAAIWDVQKYGKLYMGLIVIDNLNGNNIGTNNTALFGKINVNMKTNAHAMGIEFLTSTLVRISIDKTGQLSMMESLGAKNGNNRFRIPITWIES